MGNRSSNGKEKQTSEEGSGEETTNIQRWSRLLVRANRTHVLSLQDEEVTNRGLIELNKLGEEYLGSIKHLELSKNNLTTLHLSSYNPNPSPRDSGRSLGRAKSGLSNTGRMRHSFLSEGDRERKEEGSVCPWKSLKVLDISHNPDLSSVYDLIRVAETLMVLKATHTTLRRFPIEVSKLTHLTTLNLDNNHLKTIPDEIGLLSSLKQLTLSHNELSAIPTALMYLPHLLALDISSNKLTNFPPLSFFSPKCIRTAENTLKLPHGSLRVCGVRMNQPHANPFPSLTDLNARGNLIEGVRSTICFFKSLKYLDLSFNRISSLPHEMCVLSSLSHLRLQFNRLSLLPNEFGDLSDIRRLFLNNNQLRTIPDSFSKLSLCTHLYLSCNQFTTIPQGVLEMPSLSLLHLFKNYIQEIPDSLSLSQTLREIDLSFNSISHIPSSLGEMSCLLSLRINGNPIDLPPEILSLQTVVLKEYLRADTRTREHLQAQADIFSSRATPTGRQDDLDLNDSVDLIGISRVSYSITPSLSTSLVNSTSNSRGPRLNTSGVLYEDVDDEEG